MQVPIEVALAVFAVTTLCVGAAVGEEGVDGERAAAREAAQWLEQNAVVMGSINPANEHFADLQRFGEAIGDARIVALGEQSHGDGAVFDLKGRLIRYLHQKKGFDVVLYEAGIFGAFRLEQVVREGAETLSDRILTSNELADTYGQSEESRKTLRYLDAHRASATPLAFYGMDSHQTGRSARMDLVRMLDELLAHRGSRLRESPDWGEMGRLLHQLIRNDPDKPSPERQAIFYRVVDEIAAEVCAAQPDSYLFPDSPGIWCRIVRSLRNQADRFWRGEPSREVEMAENAKWLLDHPLKGRKVVIWSHSMHVTRHELGGGPSFGQALAKAYGEAYYVVQFTASGGATLDVSDRTPHDVAPNRPGSVEDVLHRLGKPLLFVDSRQQRPPEALSSLPEKELEYRQWSPSCRLGTAYDGLFQLETVRPVTMP